VRDTYERADAPRDYERQTVNISDDDRYTEYRDDRVQTTDRETYIPNEPMEGEREEPAVRRYTNEDLMPMYRTMRLKDTSADREKEKSRKYEPAKSGKLSATAKMMIAVYALILVIAVVLIIATSVAAANKANKAAALEAQSAALQTQIVMQEDQIAALQNPSASDPRLAGYTDAASTVSISLKPVQAETAYSAETNWFNNLCNLFSH
jgi:hypothetical protein